MRLLGGRTAAAKIAKVAPQTVGNWASGRSTPDKSYLARLRAGVRRQANQAGPADPATPAPQAALPPTPLGTADASEPAQRPRGLYALPSPGGSSASSPSAGVASQPAPATPRASIPTPSGADLPAWLKKRQEALARIKPLTQAEVEKLRGSFFLSLRQFWTYADEGISYTNKRRAEARIWRTIDDEDTKILADWFIQRALVDPVAAQVVRGISHIWDLYAVGLILGPRFIETFKFYAGHGGFSL